MNVVEPDVLTLVSKEYSAAKEKWGPLASLPEGYAVLLEEVEETEEAVSNVRQCLSALWKGVRGGNEDIMITTAAMLVCAEKAACEAIQVAAVCKRILDLFTDKKSD